MADERPAPAALQILCTALCVFFNLMTNEDSSERKKGSEIYYY